MSYSRRMPEVHVEESIQSFIVKGLPIPRAKMSRSHDIPQQEIFRSRRREFKDVGHQGDLGPMSSRHAKRTLGG